MPEIWQCVSHAHNSPRDVMYDLCDGAYIQRHPLFQRNTSALQIILYTDEIKLVNPIGAHVKKQSNLFYFTLGNTPPQFRSKLSSIYLLGMANHLDMKRFGPDKILADFIEMGTQPSRGGIEMDISDVRQNIEGALVAVTGDTPAINWSGGFKEGVLFAYKGCKTCDATTENMKVVFKQTDFQPRDEEEHKQRCICLDTVTKAAKVY